MKRVVLSLLMCSSLLGGIEYPSLVNAYLDGVQMESQEQHDRVERVLLCLEGMDRDDLGRVMGYMCMILQWSGPLEDDCGCDCCTDSLVDELIEEEFGPENCC